MDRCEECGGRFDRPGLYRCDDPRHPAPDLAQRIAAAIERDVNDRRGLKWTGIEEETQYHIRDKWAELIRAELEADRP